MDNQSNESKERIEFIKVLEERRRQEANRVAKSKEGDANMSWTKRVLGFSKKMSAEDIPEIDIKGTRNKRKGAPQVPLSQIERQLYKIGIYFFKKF